MSDTVKNFLLGGIFIFFLFGLLKVYQNQKSWENPIVQYYEIQDPQTEKIYICHPDSLWVSNRSGRVEFTDTNNIKGHLLNYIILKEGRLIKRKSK